MLTIVPLTLSALMLMQGLANAPSDTTVRVVSYIEDLGFDASSVVVARTGLIYFTADDAIRAYDPVRRVAFVVDSSPATDLTVSARGDRLAFARGEPWLSVWTMRVDPATGRSIAPPRRLSVTSGRAPAFSPDGKWLAFSVLPADDTLITPRIIRVPANGGVEQVLSREAGFAQQLRWSPDGRWIFYRHGMATAQGRRRTLHRVRSDGAQHLVMNDIGVFIGLSPDGTTLAYVENERPRMGNQDKIVVLADQAGRLRRRIVLPPDIMPMAWGPGDDQLLVPRGRSVTKWRAVDLNGRIRDVASPSGSSNPTDTDNPFRWRFASGDSLVFIDRTNGRERWLPQCAILLAPPKRDSTLVCLERGVGTRAVLEVHALTGQSRSLRTLDLPEQTRPGVRLFGDTLLAIAFSGRVMLAPLHGGAVRTVFQGQSLAHHSVSLSPDGQWLAFVSSKTDNDVHDRGLALRLLSAATGELRSIPLPNMNIISSAQWDPQQRYVAIHGEVGPRSDVWMIPLNGDQPFPLTRGETSGVSAFSINQNGDELRYPVVHRTTSLWTVDLRSPGIGRQ